MPYRAAVLLPLARSLHPVENQRGVALILAISMLTILSILGALALSTSITEIGISGNYRASQQAFLAADRAVEYAVVSEGIFSTIGTGSVDLTGLHAEAIAAGTSKGGLKAGEVNRVSYVSTGALPPESGTDPTYFQARYYVVTVTGEGPNDSTAQLESQVARVVPR